MGAGEFEKRMLPQLASSIFVWNIRVSREREVVNEIQDVAVPLKISCPT